MRIIDSPGVELYPNKPAERTITELRSSCLRIRSVLNWNTLPGCVEQNTKRIKKKSAQALIISN